jgi:hypothetical protein
MRSVIITYVSLFRVERAYGYFNTKKKGIVIYIKKLSNLLEQLVSDAF